MTYLQFHLVFILPPLVLLAAAVTSARARLPRRASWALPAVALIAIAYTTPWDNYLVWRGVWRYGGERVIGTIGYVPVEEYLFFLLQPVLTGLLLYVLLARQAKRAISAQVAARASRAADELASARAPGRRMRHAGVALYVVLAGAGGLALLEGDRYTYAGLILAWAAPVLAAQWWFAAAAVRAHSRAFAIAVTVSTVYLWIADRIAIGLGIWTIAPELSTGHMLLGLPIEEALFFLMTDLLVVQGLLWFLHPRTGEARAAIAAPRAERSPTPASM